MNAQLNLNGARNLTRRILRYPTVSFVKKNFQLTGPNWSGVSIYFVRSRPGHPKASHNHDEIRGIFGPTTPLLTTVSVVVLAFGPPRTVFKAARVFSQGSIRFEILCHGQELHPGHGKDSRQHTFLLPLSYHD